MGEGRVCPPHVCVIQKTPCGIGLILGSYVWKSNYNWVVDSRNMPVEDLIRSQLQSEEEFTDQRSSHFKLCMVVNFKSL